MDPNQNGTAMPDHDQATTSAVEDNAKQGPVDVQVVFNEVDMGPSGSQGPTNGNGAACTIDVQPPTPRLGEAPPKKQRLYKRAKFNSEKVVNENEITHGVVQTLDALPVERRSYHSSIRLNC